MNRIIWTYGPGGARMESSVHLPAPPGDTPAEYHARIVSYLWERAGRLGDVYIVASDCGCRWGLLCNCQTRGAA